jgi:mono/diheme cytochrome c family protein
LIQFLLKGAIIGPLLLTQLSFSQTLPATKVDQATLEKGKRLYIANCLRCHNKDPNVKGSIGPEIVDAPYAVMYSKVMTGKYPDPLPPGFVPKRKSRAMAAIPKLKADIPAIWHYVQSIKKK